MLNFPGCIAGKGTDTSVLDRQRLRFTLLQQQQNQQPSLQPKSFDLCSMPQFLIHNGGGELSSGFPVLGTEFRDVINNSNAFGSASPEIASSSLEMDHHHCTLSRTSSYAPPVTEAARAANFEIGGDGGLMKMVECNNTIGGNSLKKRKAESRDKSRNKSRNRGDAATGEEDHSTHNSKENSKNSKDQNQKPDYIHVRARRGQATDSHSLAERARREKISKKMKCLQELVPGCNKTTGKAGMLDETINYVQSLQRQVEFLSMKLAHVSPINVDNIFGKEFPACFATTLSEMASLSYTQPNSVQQGAPSCELDMPMPLSPPQTAPQIISSSPVQVQSFSTWETDLQKLYNAGFQ